MTETLLERSTRFIDDGVYEGVKENNPMDLRVEEVADGIAVVCAFSHVWAIDSGSGLAVFDTSLEAFGRPAVEAHIQAESFFSMSKPESESPRLVTKSNRSSPQTFPLTTTLWHLVDPTSS